LRASELDLGLWIIKTAGNPDAVLAFDEFILNHQHNWFVREVLGMMRRTFARMMSRHDPSMQSSNPVPVLPARCWNWRSLPTASTCATHKKMEVSQA